jgi:hypothetical protein
MFPRGFIFGVVISLDLVESGSIIACDSVLLVKNLDGVSCTSNQVPMEWCLR